MLQAIRTRAGSIVVKILFGLLILSFGLWGIYTRSPFSDSGSSDTVIATVGGQDIRAAALQAELQPTLEQLSTQYGRAIDLQQARQLGVVDGLLGELIDRSLLDQEARHLRLDVSDAVVRSVIVDNPAFRGPDGRFDRDLFNQALLMNHMTEEDYVARARRDIPAGDLIQALTGSAALPQPIVDALYRYRQQRRVADVVALPVAGAADPGQPKEAELAKFYDAHQELFRTPEFRGFTVASLTPDDLAKRIAVPEDQLRKAYDERKAQFATPERRDVQQIIAPSEAKAKEAAAALAQGKSWQEVATTIAGQNPQTIDLGLLQREGLPEPLSKLAFGLPLDKPSAPIDTPLGWHIVRVVKIVPAGTQSFAQAKPKLAAAMARSEAADRIYDTRDNMEDALSGGAPVAKVASRFGLNTTTVAAADAGGRDPGGKPIALPVATPQVMKLVFATEQGQTSRVIDTPQDAVFLVHVDKVIPSHVKALREVKDKVTALWQAQRKRDMVAAQAKKLAAAVNPKTPLATLAAQQHLALFTPPPLMRRPAPDGKVPPLLLARLFSAKPGAVVTAEDPAGAYVAQLKSVEEPKSIPAAARLELSQQLSASARDDLAVELTRALRRRFPVDIDNKALDRLF